MIASNTRKLILASGTALAVLATTPAFAQSLPAGAAEDPDAREAIIVTGSRIKRDPTDSSLPLQIISTQDLSREGISSPEQLISYLSTNGNGADNLASNSDVVSGAARGTNGLSAANLRGQGSASTLVLLNGRRVAAHGLQGSAVDVNQIPFAAIERIEVLKDGASAIYGTDAIGGVINFITKKNFTGVTLNAFTDVTELGDSPIYRLSATAGYGKLDEQGFNIMGSVSKSWNSALFGSDRDFVNGNQPNRGLSIDTRGTPIATAFPINPTATGIGITQGLGTLLGGTSGTLVNLNDAGGIRQSGGINPLRLPGGAGCASVDGGMNYDSVLWANTSAAFACAWDTGRAATLQQPIETLTYYGRATARIGGSHEIFAEVTGSNADSAKIFSNNQYSANNTTLPIAYPLITGVTDATYNQVYDTIAASFPGIGPVGDRNRTDVSQTNRYGLPIAFRYRCIACGPREYQTTTKTFRAAIGAEGPLFAGWDYRAGGSYASSTASSILGSGYHYRGTFNGAAAATASGVAGAISGGADTRAPTAPGATAPGIVGLFNSGILNPFSITQTPQALAALDAISARGVKLYGGKYEVKQVDASISGELFPLPGGMVQVAIGVDYRRESYKFDGSGAGSISSPDIFNVAFDNINALNQVSRNVKAAYAEVLIPIFKPLEITVAGRIDDYTGFGSTFNPKVSAKFRPVDWLMFRGSYNTGFRVPTFNQIFNGTTLAPNPGNTLVDPSTCPSGVVSATPGCSAITPDSLSGGNLTLEPETSKQASVGIVLQPSSRFSLSVDYWTISVDNVIGSITIPQLLANLNAFPNRVTRTGGVITLVDLRTGNFGSRRTQGLEFAARAGTDAFGGVISGGFDGTLLLVKREKLLPNLAYTNLRGVFSLAGDLGLKWKHNAWVSFAKDGFTATFSQIYRDGYQNQALPASPSRPDFNPRVKAYTTYNASLSQRIDERFQITAGVRNVFNTDPPFAITYDSNTGSGSSWEPRVADPRGRSFTMAVEVRF
jgi:iron complex outermembrane recepter protein